MLKFSKKSEKRKENIKNQRGEIIKMNTKLLRNGKNRETRRTELTQEDEEKIKQEENEIITLTEIEEAINKVKIGKALKIDVLY